MFSVKLNNTLPLAAYNIKVRIVIFLLLILWTAGYTNLLFKTPAAVVYPFIKHGYSTVCHQDSARTISFAGTDMLVCARCTGIYSGALAASLLSLLIPFRKLPAIKYLIFSAVPVIFDVVLYNTGVYNYSKALSLATGLFFGSVVFIYILEVLEKYISGNGQQ